MRFARAVFLIAGIYGVVILAPMYFLESRIGREQPPAITHPEYFYGFLGVGLSWQILFLMLSRDPLRYRAMILPSVLEKVSYGIALAILFAQHRLPLSVLAIGSVDWIFAALFIAAYAATKPDHRDTSNLMKSPDWRIECNVAIFEKIKSDESFHQILALARAINGLQFVISAMVTDAQDFSPAARRSRINSFLFGSAILYEGLLLVENMNKHFGRDEVFNQGLHTLLRDPAARTLRRSHMGPARNFAVFHYDPEEFGRIVNSASVYECEFMTGRGNSSPESYFPFADTLAAEVLMGEANANEDFYKRLGLVMSETRDLSIRFMKFSERLISKCLHDWGFIHKTSALP